MLNQSERGEGIWILLPQLYKSHNLPGFQLKRVREAPPGCERRRRRRRLETDNGDGLRRTTACALPGLGVPEMASCIIDQLQTFRVTSFAPSKSCSTSFFFVERSNNTLFFRPKKSAHLKLVCGIYGEMVDCASSQLKWVPEKIVRIDLGTRKSARAIVKRSDGKLNTPSMLGRKKNGDWSVAQATKRQALFLAQTDKRPNKLGDKFPAAVAQKFGEKLGGLKNAISEGTATERVSILVIGGGGREHALCYALQHSPSCDTVFCAPGNSGIANSGDATCITDLDINDSSAVISFCYEWGVGLVVVGPEAPLVSGLANDLAEAGIATFGPSSEAAALEGSKNFMKNLCDKYGIPTAKYRTFTDPTTAKSYIKEQGAPIVVKADGLAAGKGVIVAMAAEEAYEAVDSMLVKGAFGSAGRCVVIEEYLEGEEASFFAIVDGENAIPLESAQDHKRVGDGDSGPNTGGMGAYSPAPVLTEELQSLVMKSIILPTVRGMSNEGCKFVGVLYAGLMIEKKSGLPKLIEYNVRFGDPECQVLMMRLESDLAQVLLAACRGELSNVSLQWSPGSAMVVVMASNGYPGSYEKGTTIRNLEEAEQASPCVKIFHAGTATNSDGEYIANGGRVLGVTAKGKDLEEARERAYRAVEEIDWQGGFYRRDIGWRALPIRQLS